MIHAMNSFSRTVANEQKKGAYYTDSGMCKRIGRLLAFPEDEEVSVLEPSIGDGSAVRAVLDNVTVKGKGASVFGVELDAEVAEETKRVFKGLSQDNVIIQADFLSGMKMSYTSFGMCFANPPYRKADKLNEESLETQFMRGIYPLLKKFGVLVYVIPHYTLSNLTDFIKPFLVRFDPIAVYRFDDKEYAQFQQCVLIGRRRNRMADWSDEMNELKERFRERVANPENIPYLPALDEEIEEDRLVVVPASPARDVQTFTTRFFDYAKAGSALTERSPLYKEESRRLEAQRYQQAELTKPPVPLKKDLLYLCAIAGGGQGYCGSEENGDLHLQRGVVKTISTEELVGKENGNGSVIVEHTRAAVSMTVLENDGTFHTFS